MPSTERTRLQLVCTSCLEDYAELGSSMCLMCQYERERDKERVSSEDVVSAHDPVPKARTKANGAELHERETCEELEKTWNKLVPRHRDIDSVTTVAIPTNGDIDESLARKRQAQRGERDLITSSLSDPSLSEKERKALKAHLTKAERGGLLLMEVPDAVPQASDAELDEWEADQERAELAAEFSIYPGEHRHYRDDGVAGMCEDCGARVATKAGLDDKCYMRRRRENRP
jgi:hypothetical protein